MYHTVYGRNSITATAKTHRRQEIFPQLNGSSKFSLVMAKYKRLKQPRWRPENLYRRQISSVLSQHSASLKQKGDNYNSMLI